MAKTRSQLRNISSCNTEQMETGPWRMWLGVRLLDVRSRRSNPICAAHCGSYILPPPSFSLLFYQMEVKGGIIDKLDVMMKPVPPHKALGAAP